MRIIQYVSSGDRRIWWTSKFCEHCGASTVDTVDSFIRPWTCVKRGGCGKVIQSFDTLRKANDYYNPLIIMDDLGPVPLPSPPNTDKLKPPVDYFAITKSIAGG